MGLIIEGLRFRRGDILTPASLARILSLRGTTGRRVREGEAPGKIYYYERVRDPLRLRVRDEMALLLDHPEMKERINDPSHNIERILLTKAIRALKYAKAESSKFKVGAAALTLDGEGRRWLVMGWNREPVNDDSTHAEESIVAKMGPDEVIMHLAAVSQEHKLLSPCGDCRDFLLSWADASARVLLPGGNVSLASLFPCTFPTVDRKALSAADKALIKAAQRILEGAYAPHSNRAKGAAIRTSHGVIFPASVVEDVAWHHDHAVEIALGMIDAHRQRMVEEVAIFNGCSGREPHTPCGRCRQKLNRAAQISGRDFRVLMTSGGGQIIHAATVSQLLPYPFGPAEFGIDLSRYRTL